MRLILSKPPKVLMFRLVSPSIAISKQAYHDEPGLFLWLVGEDDKFSIRQSQMIILPPFPK